MFINSWYVAERSRNLTAGRPLKVRMLGRDFVLFRDAAGRAAYLSNVCPHRGASLADGRCRDDGSIACPYHGWRFDAAGVCVKAPAERDPARPPAAAKIDAYPVEEKSGLIWVFLGDRPDRAAPPFDILEVSDPGYRQIDIDEAWDCSYHRAVEIDLDYVHSHFVHGAWGEEHRARPPDHVVEDWTAAGFGSHLIARSQPNRGLWRVLRKEGKGVPSYLKFKLPGFCRRVQVFIGGEGSTMHFVFYHFSTPIDAGRVQNRLVFFRSFMRYPLFDATNIKRNRRAILEDRRICEGIAPKVAAATRTREVQAEHDHLIDAYHRILDGLAAKGWQIDVAALADMDARGIAAAIPSPARRASPEGWVYPEVPRLPPRAAIKTAVA